MSRERLNGKWMTVRNGEWHREWRYRETELDAGQWASREGTADRCHIHCFAVQLVIDSITCTKYSLYNKRARVGCDASQWMKPPLNLAACKSAAPKHITRIQAKCSRSAQQGTSSPLLLQQLLPNNVRGQQGAEMHLHSRPTSDPAPNPPRGHPHPGPGKKGCDRVQTEPEHLSST